MSEHAHKGNGKTMPRGPVKTSGRKDPKLTKGA